MSGKKQVIYVVFNGLTGEGIDRPELTPLLITFDEERARQMARNVKGIMAALPILIEYYDV